MSSRDSRTLTPCSKSLESNPLSSVVLYGLLAASKKVVCRLFCRAACTVATDNPNSSSLIFLRRTAVSQRTSTETVIPMPSPTCNTVGRSEEHTSELQSLRHLVCRLLL